MYFASLYNRPSKSISVVPAQEQKAIFLQSYASNYYEDHHKHFILPAKLRQLNFMEIIPVPKSGIHQFIEAEPE